jgi:hypothetical protein
MKNILKKAGLVAGSVGTSLGVYAIPCFAAGTADPAVTSALTTIQENAVATLQAIAPIAILIFGSIFVWRVGKKVFNIIAK